MKKLTLIALLSLTLSFQVLAQQPQKVNEAEARQTAKAFAATKSHTKGESLTLVSSDEIYIYNIGDNGFVIVTGDRVLPPILGYSMTETFPSLDDAPENFSSWISHYKDMILFAREKGIQPEESVRSSWERASHGIFGDRNATSIDPIITTHWNQDCYYNEYCPYTGGSGWWDDGGPCGHAYAGCVACAMAQVMKYWNHPVQGLGSHSYTHPTYGVQSADFGNTTYQWNQMPSEIYYHNDAIATLMYHCGVSVNMNYGPGGSGAQSTAVETALRSYFGYCGATYREKSKYTEEVWINMLKADLDQLHPIYYSGSSGSAGHAFVCDGYDDNDLFHFNFGWSGAGDTFYSLYDVNGYNIGQAAVMNIVPMDIRPDNNGIIYISADGEGNGSSWDQATKHLEFASYLSSGDNLMVWVKKGVYYGNDSDPDNAFCITKSNRIYGGFNGDEGPDFNLNDRDLVNNATILDGRGVKRVLFQSEELTSSTQAVWDGFTIQNGYAGSGAGVYVNGYLTLSNCVIQDNVATAFGGGVYVNATSAGKHVLINQCKMKDNTAAMGGGLCDRNGSSITNCLISNNIASTKGGGIYAYNNAKPLLRGCIIANNTADEGGGFYARGFTQLINCNIVQNLAHTRYGGVFNENNANIYTNCILWGNEANGAANQYIGTCHFEYCAVQGGVSGENNITLPADNTGDEPGVFVRFKQPAQGAGADFEGANWDIYQRSICLNRGKLDATYYATDFAGNDRLQHDRIDIGAYEKNASLTLIEASFFEGQTYWFNNMPLQQPGYYTTVYPTPTCDSVVGLTLSVIWNTTEFTEGNPQTETISIEVISLLGQHIRKIHSEKELATMDLKPGCYILKIQSSEGIMSKKIIIP
jgi:parallel beta-helix repeat protein